MFNKINETTYEYVDEGLLQELIPVIGSRDGYESSLTDTLLINLYGKRISDEFLAVKDTLKIEASDEPPFKIEYSTGDTRSLVIVQLDDRGVLLWTVVEKTN